MSNKSVSEFVAATMNAVLNSDEHKALFGTKLAWQDEHDAKGECPKCGKKEGKDEDSCSCGDYMSAEAPAAPAKFDPNFGGKPVSGPTVNSAGTHEDKVATALNVAIDSLLTASAALDLVGMDQSAEYSLKLASLVVEAKKKEMSKKHMKKDMKKKEEEKKDMQMAKDKAKAKEMKEKEKAKEMAEKEKAKEKAAKEKAKEMAEKAKAKSKK